MARWKRQRMVDSGLSSNDDQEGMVPVTLPSGALFSVHMKEFQYFKDRSSKYLTDNDFQNVSDYQDLDRLMIAELLCYRWGLWISSQRDYWGETVDENTLQKALKEHSAELRQLKKTLGLDRETREKVRGEDSVENYLAQLRLRAKHFKHKLRYPQAAKATELFMELKGIITLHQNCLAHETELLTLEGVRRIGDLTGKQITVLNGNGGWQEIEVKSFGVQPLIEIILQRNFTLKTVYATRDHRWILRGKNHSRIEATTATLSAGDHLISVFGHLPGTVELSPYGVAAGIVFGDGSCPSRQIGTGSHVKLCGEKDRNLLKWFPLSETTQEDDGIVVKNLPRSWKNTIPLSESYGYMYGWLAGYLAADGTISEAGSSSITSYEEWRVQGARDVAYRIGFPTLGITQHTRPSPFNGEIRTAYRLNFPVGGLPPEFFLIPEHRVRAVKRPRLRGDVLPDWKVKSVRETERVEEVYCAEVPGPRSFVLADNLLTGNCDEKERIQQGVTMDHVLKWLTEEAFPAFDKIDEEFRKEQETWIRKL